MISGYLKNNFHKAYYIIFIVLLFLVTPINISSLTIGIATIVVIALFFNKPFPISKKDLLKTAPLIAYSLILIISTFYSTDKGSALKEIEKRGVFIIFFILFILFDKSHLQNFRSKLTKTFIALITLTYIITNVLLMLKLKQAVSEGLLSGSVYEILQQDMFYYLYRTYSEIITDIHPTYASAMLLFSAGIILIRLINNFNTYTFSKRMLLATLAILPLMMSFMLASKGPIIAFFLALPISFLFKRKKYFLYMIISSVLICSAAVLTVPTLKSRVMEIFSDNHENGNTISERKTISLCSLEKVMHKPMWGYGIGDVCAELSNCYLSKGATKCYEMKFNTHNEYMNSWLSAGLPGLLSFLIIFIVFIYNAIKKKDIESLFFIFMLMTCLLFENMLARQKGVIFFTFFYYLYSYTIPGKSSQPVEE